MRKTCEMAAMIVLQERESRNHILQTHDATYGE